LDTLDDLPRLATFLALATAPMATAKEVDLTSVNFIMLEKKASTGG
jgi:hypothetical protein